MSRTRRLLGIAIGALLLLLAGSTSTGLADTTESQSATAGTSSTNPFFNTWGTCRNSNPYKPPMRRCHYDRGRWFRGTFVLKSKVGKVNLKACFRIYARPPLGGRHGCGYPRMALKYKAYPFWVRGTRQAFKVRLRWFARGVGSTEKYGLAGVSWMRVRP